MQKNTSFLFMSTQQAKQHIYLIYVLYDFVYGHLSIKPKYQSLAIYIWLYWNSIKIHLVTKYLSNIFKTLRHVEHILLTEISLPKKFYFPIILTLIAMNLFMLNLWVDFIRFFYFFLDLSQWILGITTIACVSILIAIKRKQKTKKNTIKKTEKKQIIETQKKQENAVILTLEKLAQQQVKKEKNKTMPASFQKSKITKSRTNIWQTHIILFLEMILICLDSGINFKQALKIIAQDTRKQHPEFSKEIERVFGAFTMCFDDIQTIQTLMLQTNSPELRNLLALIGHHITHGSSLNESIESLLNQTIRDRHLYMEKQAASLPSKLSAIITFMSIAILFIAISPIFLKTTKSFSQLDQVGNKSIKKTQNKPKGGANKIL